MMPRNQRRALFVALVLCLSLALPARAEVTRTKTHVVRKGDTLALLAAEFYGNRRYAVFIMVENRMKHPRKLRPGERISIPIGYDITAQGGETWASLAKKYLGSAKRAEFLAHSNGTKVGGTLAAGVKIRIPMRVIHEAASTESLAMIAAAYLGDRRKAELLREYNVLEGDTIPKGKRIEVPIEHVHVRSGQTPDAAARKREAKRKRVQVLAERHLDDAYDAWRAGKYDIVTAKLAPLETEYVDADTAAQIGVLLGRAHIAFGNKSAAKQAFERALKRQPTKILSPRDISPTVLAVWKQAGGKVASDTK